MLIANFEQVQSSGMGMETVGNPTKLSTFEK